jgi:hypothetical protein
MRSPKLWRNTAVTSVMLVILSVSLSTSSFAADRIKWKPLIDAILKINGGAPKQWSVYSADKKNDPLLLQLGARYFAIYVRDQTVYKIPPAKLERTGDNLLWRESDRPRKPLPSSKWSTRDVGSAYRIRLDLTDEHLHIDIQIPHPPDLRGLY